MSTPGSGAQSPDLTIPIALDVAKVLEDVKKLRAELKDLTGEAKDGFDDAGKSASGFGATLATFASHQGWQFLKDGAAVLVENFREVSEHITRIATKYVEVRQALQAVAALKGVPNTGSYTADEVRAARAAGLTPGESVDFQQAFQTAAGAFIGGPDAKMAADDVERYQLQLAAFAKARGAPIQNVADVGGSVLQFATGRLTAEEAMKRVAGTFAVMEPAPGDLGMLLNKSSEIMSLGASAEEAGQLLHLSTYESKREGPAHLRQLILQLQTAARDQEKAGELGIDSRMGPMQTVETAARSIAARAQQGEAVGDVVARYLNDVNAIGSMNAMVNQGVLGGGFDKVRNIVRNTPADFIDRQVAEYRATDSGKDAQALADVMASEVLAGEKYGSYPRERNIAKAQENEAGTLEGLDPLGRIWAMTTQALTLGAAPGYQDQLINARVRRNAYERYVAATGGGEPGTPMGDFLRVGADSLNRSDAATADYLRLIEAHLAKLAANASKPAESKPLNAQPPAPRTRP